MKRRRASERITERVIERVTERVSERVDERKRPKLVDSLAKSHASLIARRACTKTVSRDVVTIIRISSVIVSLLKRFESHERARQQ